jgi:hypothetical protein
LKVVTIRTFGAWSTSGPVTSASRRVAEGLVDGEVRAGR